MHQHEQAIMRLDIRPGTRKLVLLAVASFADEAGRGARPAVQTTIAEMCNITGRSAQRHVTELRVSGHLRVAGEYVTGSGRYVISYDIALDEQTRLHWAAEAAGQFGKWSQELSTPDTGVVAQEPTQDTSVVRPITTTSTDLKELRSLSGAAGAAVEEESMPAPGFEEQPETLKPRGRRSEPDEAPSGAPGFREDDRMIERRENGAQRVSDLNRTFRAKVEAVSPMLQHNTKAFTSALGTRIREQGLSVQRVAQMIDLFFMDPSFMARHDRRRSHAWQFFLDRWSELYERTAVEQKTYDVDTDQDEQDRRLLGLD